MTNLSKVNLNQGQDFTIKSPYPQAYIIMKKDTEDKSFQFKGPRIYVDVLKAQERCDAMNRYNKDKPHIVVGFDLTSDHEKLDMWYSKDFDEVRIRANYNYGVQVAKFGSTAYFATNNL